MRRLIYFGTAAACALALSAAPAAAHNAGCVQTGNGNGEWVFVGSNKSAPDVPEQNPHYHSAPDGDQKRLDLLEGPGDQFGVRFAAAQHSDVGPQPPSKCTAPPPRGQ